MTPGNPDHRPIAPGLLDDADPTLHGRSDPSEPRATLAEFATALVE